MDPAPAGRPAHGTRCRAAAVGAAAGCAALLVLLAVVTALHPQATTGVERALHTWSLQHRPRTAADTARLVTATGSGAVPWLAATAAGAAAAPAARRLRGAGAFLLALGAGQAVRYGVMEAVARLRPPRADWAAPASGFSFPSGHTFTSAVTAGLLCWAVARRARPAATRWACAALACWAAAVGLSRVYLGVHWAGDVLGGWLLAAVWLAAAVPLLARAVRPPGGGPGSPRREAGVTAAAEGPLRPGPHPGRRRQV